MAVTVATKLKLLRERVSSLSVSDDTLEKARKTIEDAGLSPKTLESLRLEWLNDMMSIRSKSEFRHAASNPDQHFLTWIEERSKHKYHVSRRTVLSAAKTYGHEIASKLQIVIWPQEVAWAQRMRLDENPFTATKAALFLRETESNPSKVFLEISDILSDAIKTSGYLNSKVKEFSPDEIRFSSEVPEFAPLFQRYAARHYTEKLKNMSREQLEVLASRAADAENMDRRKIASKEIVNLSKKSPMRHSISNIRSAILFKLTPNELFLLENAFNKLLVAGEFEVDPSMRTADSHFLRIMGDKKRRNNLIAIEELPDPDDLMSTWDIVHLNAGITSTMPKGLKSLKCTIEQFQGWQEDIVEGKRELPYDIYTDIGFHLLGAK